MVAALSLPTPGPVDAEVSATSAQSAVGSLGSANASVGSASVGSASVGSASVGSASVGRPASIAARNPREVSPGFADLDRTLTDPARSFGLVAVRAPFESLSAVASHVRRRLEGRGLEVLSVDGRTTDDPFRDALSRVVAGRGPKPIDAAAAAAATLAGLAGSRRALVVVEPTRSAWGAAVGAELARLAAADGLVSVDGLAAADGLTAKVGLGGALVVWLATSFVGVEIDPFEIAGTLSEPELERWWRAAADEAAAGVRRRRGGSVGPRTQGTGAVADSDRLADLDQWWSTALALPADAELPSPTLSAEASRVLRALLLARCAWPASRLAELLGNERAADGHVASALDELCRHELVAMDGSSLVAVTTRGGARTAAPSSFGAKSPSFATCAHATRADATWADATWARPVALALIHATPVADPWSRCRAAEILAELGDVDEAEAVAHGALASLADAPVRDDLWRRWIEALDGAIEGRGNDERAARLVRSSEVAVRVGHVDMALRLARASATAAPGDHATLLAMGRALAARGDLVGAGVALERALQQARGRLERAAACVELAEVRYGTGDLEGASAWAAQAVDASAVDASAVDASAVDPSVGSDGSEARCIAARARIGARNVLGKVLLARGAWNEAEVHFAADSLEAACAGEGIAELRAQTNRAIALLSSGRLEEARQMLLAVHDAGEARGELRALTFALANLATLATLQHRYAEALSLSERAFHAYRRLGERVRLAPLATNLAELRLRLGLVDEAEHGLRFGIKACGTDMPAMRLAHFSFVTAQVQLARGRTQAAATELASALAGMQGGEGSTSWGGPAGLLLSQCHRLSARVALEDGDLRRAQRALDIARNEPPSLFARAEIAILDATVAQASGDTFVQQAARALELAREADDVELLVEAHALVAEASLASVAPTFECVDLDRASLSLRAARAVRDEVADSLPGALRTAYLGRPHAPDLDRLAARIEAARSASGSGSSPPSALDRVATLPPPPARSSGGLPSGVANRGRVPGAALGPAAAAVFARIVGRDPSILALLTAIPKVAASDATVLVFGESGTGKELVAEAVHAASGRASGPLVKVNCAALVETLLLSELFGHEKGAFTGAASRRRGRFEAAEGGTLFLDEIGDISPRTQVALLRVLQDRTYERVGGTTSLRANVRIVCATHRDLQTMVARGTFREDLYYRLRGVVLEVPSLRSRIGDLGAISETLLERLATERHEEAPKRLADRALVALAAHPWPGNVREFENALRAAALFAEGETIELEDFTDNVQGLSELKAPEARPSTSGTSDGSASSARAAGAPSGLPQSVPPTLRLPVEALDSPARATDVAYSAVRGGVSLGEMKRRIERECVSRALIESDGNITRAATLLGMKRPRLSQLVKQFGLHAGGQDAGGQDAGGQDAGGQDAGDQDGAEADSATGGREWADSGADSCDPEDV